MNILKAKFRVVKETDRRQYIKQYNRLQLVVTLFGFRVFVLSLTRELIPPQVIAQLGAFGYTDWKSELILLCSKLNENII